MAKNTENTEKKDVAETGTPETWHPLPFEAAQETGNTSESGQVMYIGPTVKGVIQKNTIYRNGGTDKLADTLAGKTGLAKGFISPLFVPVENLAQAKDVLLRKDSKLGVCYAAVAGASVL